MPTIEVIASTADTHIYSDDAAYANARAGTGTLGLESVSATAVYVGQADNTTFFRIYEPMMEFDVYAKWIADGYTAAQIATMTVSLALLRTAVHENGGATKTYDVRLYDFGAAITTADWVAGASLGSKTLLASVVSNTLPAVGSTFNWVDVAFAANVSKTTTPTRVMMAARDQLDNIAPSGGASDRIGLSSADHATAGLRPTLLVTFSLPSGLLLLASD